MFGSAFATGNFAEFKPNDYAAGLLLYQEPEYIKHLRLKTQIKNELKKELKNGIVDKFSDIETDIQENINDIKKSGDEYFNLNSHQNDYLKFVGQLQGQIRKLEKEKEEKEKNEIIFRLALEKEKKIKEKEKNERPSRFQKFKNFFTWKKKQEIYSDEESIKTFINPKLTRFQKFKNLFKKKENKTGIFKRFRFKAQELFVKKQKGFDL